MLGTSLEQLGNLFDRQFLVAYWGPTFLGVMVAGAIFTLAKGLSQTIAAWLKLSGTQQVLYAAASLVGITVIAYAFSVLTTPLIRMYEGYWPSWMWPLALLFRRRWLKGPHHRINRREQPRQAKGSTPEALYFHSFVSFPRNPARVKPTRLGNILAAAEEYPRLRYNMDAVFWWPRLVPVMPDVMRTQVDANITPMIALLNTATMLIFVGFGGGIWLLLSQEQPWWGIGCIIAGILLSFGCYRAAAIQAVSYSLAVRTAFDLYRFDVLKQLHIPLPSPSTERQLWDSMAQWLYIGDLRYRVAHYDHDPILATQTAQTANADEIKGPGHNHHADETTAPRLMRWRCRFFHFVRAYSASSHAAILQWVRLNWYH